MLRRKLLRTAKVYKVQFISMILLIALGIGVFVGFNAEWVTIGKDTDAFFKDCGFADYRIVDEDGISSADVDKIRDIEGVSGVSRFLSVNADVKGSSDQLALTITESEHTSGFVLTEGEDYDRWDAESFWLMDKYAELNGIKPGDKLTVTFEDLEFTGTVKGLIESAEYLICVRDESQVMPDFNTYGYVYASPAMLRKVIEQQVREEEPDIDDDVMSIAVKEVCDETFCQVNVNSSMDKEEIQAAADKALGRTLLILTKDENISYSESRGEMNEGRTMGAVLPVLFLAIAILTMITTMNRITISEKTQIGTLKALGFRDKRIVRHYTSYAVIISLTGAVLGMVLGYLICKMVMSQDGMMGTYFVMPDWTVHIPVWIWAIVLAIVMLTIFIGYLSVKDLLRGTAAETLRPYTPRHIHRLLLEGTAIWRRMRFGTKWNLRDIFRHKSRSAMSFIGTFGCMLMLVASFGMNQTMNNFLDTFYDGTAVYASKIFMSSDADNKDAVKLAEELEGDYSASVSAKAGDKTVSVDVYNITHGMYRFIDKDSNIIPLPEEGALICKRLARDFDAKPGDIVTVEPYGTDESYDILISGINGSLTESISMTEEYAEAIGLTESEEYRINSVYTMTAKDQIAARGDITSIQSKQDIIDSFDAFMKIFYFFIIVLIVASVLLCLIVLYNLGIMSYMERYREMATLKVLGFRNKAIGRLLISQNLWISVAGTLLGIPAGIWALNYLMNLLAGEYEMETVVGPVSILPATALNLGVAVIVGRMIARKNRKINMVEALKGTE
ncbi:MAG: FtsX-like permease family protein [Mogibacterium sp.]|nr:FtsX-like permease family protein [Mogibacterium sp.]